MVDLKIPFILGDSSGVADLAVRTASQVKLAGDEVTRLRVAAFLHGLGRVAVPNAVWEKPGPLTTSQWEQVRLHAYTASGVTLLGRLPVG